MPGPIRNTLIHVHYGEEFAPNIDQQANYKSQAQNDAGDRDVIQHR
jgi:hypothetical protein